MPGWLSRPVCHLAWLLRTGLHGGHCDRSGVHPAVLRNGVALSVAYVAYGGLWWMQAVFYGTRAASAAAQPTSDLLLQILLFFTKAGAFMFFSGLAIVPFLYQGVVQDFHWLDERQFTDAVRVAMITPGPVVITVALIGYLVVGMPGATLAAIGIFLPVFVPVLILSPWFKRQCATGRICTAGGDRSDHGVGHHPRTAVPLRSGHRRDWSDQSGRAAALQAARAVGGHRRGRRGPGPVATGPGRWRLRARRRCSH
jgi:Chromate transporter